ncbi:hypothetical protein FSP39_001866 [Pinctada imbricata]|uniref:Uncharacterized protein n=2 Tax=Pinctada imbricata TaxID=66713 RepID=A0AA89CD24_PINIB|nr:hypothetical protein FSP39_001866 [Pinctada imbricata]
MTSLTDTSSVVKDSLNVAEGQTGEKETSITQKDLSGIYTMLEKLDKKLNKIDDVDKRLLKIENIVSKLNSLEQRVVKSETEISETKRVVAELQRSHAENVSYLNGYNNLFDGLKDDITDLRENHRNVKASATQAESAVAELKTTMVAEIECSRDEIREDILDLQCRSMRDNLLFYGIPEKDDEDAEDTIVTFISGRMKIGTNIAFERVHRMGRKPDNAQRRPRPIVAKFSRFKDRELVRRQAPKTLKGTNYWVQEHFPPEIEQRRKALYPVMRDERRKKNKVALVKDRLFVNGVEYAPPEIQGQSGTTAQRTSPSYRDRKRARTGSR